MRTTTFAATIAAALVLLPTAGARAQDAPVRAPDLTSAQRWDLAAANLNAFSVALLHLGEVYGESPEEVGARLGALFAPVWGGPSGTGTPEQLARGMATNLLVWPGAEVALSTAADGAWVLRHNRPWLGWYGPAGARLGRTVAEYERFFNAAMERLAEELGLAVDARLDGGDGVLTIRTAG